MASIGRSPISASLLRLDNPIRSLTLAFWLWKALLFIAVVACPGPGYDTSTTLLSYHHATPGNQTEPLTWSLKFVRWDSIYFLHIAEQGYVFEQEWAFGYPRVLGWFISVLSHVAHYLSILALYRLSVNIFGHATAAQKLICFLSAALHIISPAGAFLSAPYGESLFSLLNLTGFYLYTSSLINEHNGITILRDIQVLTAAVLFALATIVRSNGILSGFVFAYEACMVAWTTLTQGPSLHKTRYLTILILGGCIVALGMMVPQILAYRTYCMSETYLRPWCSSPLPSIYGWVQGHYWNVGLFRYWTLSNLPLFLLATPVLVIMCQSSLWAMKAPSTLRSGSRDHSPSSVSPGSMLFRLAVPQGLLAVMALTSYHVQIVNRISSGYPVWYWYLVSSAMDSFQDHLKGRRGLVNAAQTMVAYVLIQGVLFGSFLPPA
ncbi:hypothetical protein N7523_009537 [Penicillium sp. IBT 18751x]|nr:hypothetical protein N7523_009537 [Penicillium sp. IBT 18751x]